MSNRLSGLRVIFALSVVVHTATARAADDELCADRPGLAAAACTIGAGRVQVETGLFEHELSPKGDDRAVAIAIANSLFRFGISESIELRLSWTPWQREVARPSGGGRSVASGTGDVALALAFRATPADADFALAIVPEVTLPVGSGPGTQEGWSAALHVPMQQQLGEKWQLSVTPEVDASADEVGDGRHLAYGTAIGVDYSVTDAVNVGTSARLIRKRDVDPYSDVRLGVSAALQPDADSQIDVDAQFGVNDATPRHTISLGYVRRF